VTSPWVSEVVVVAAGGSLAADSAKQAFLGERPIDETRAVIASQPGRTKAKRLVELTAGEAEDGAGLGPRSGGDRRGRLELECGQAQGHGHGGKKQSDLGHKFPLDRGWGRSRAVAHE